MTSIHKVYEAFLSKMLEDEWLHWTEEEIEADWRQLLDAAIPNFKFPRVDIDIDENGNFYGDLGVEEIQILATFMKCEWLNRVLLTWENVKPLYVERDFSQANLIDKLKGVRASGTPERELEAIINGEGKVQSKDEIIIEIYDEFLF